MLKAPEKLITTSSAMNSEGGEVVSESFDITSSEFDAQVDIVTQPEYGVSPQLVDRATLEWHKDGGKLFLQGQTTHLGLTIVGVLMALGLVVCNGRPVQDSHIPIGIVAGVSLAIFVLDKNGVNKVSKK